MSNPTNPTNPYQTPEQYPYVPIFGQPGPPAAPPRQPTFCKVIFIMDLAFSVLRGLLAGMGLAVILAAKQDAMVSRIGLWDGVFGGAMALFGISADIALLCNRRWGAMLGGMKAVAAVGALATAVWYLSFIIERMPHGSPQQFGAIIGGAVTWLIRLALLGLYVAALIAFVKWYDRHAVAAEYGPTF